MSKQSIKLQRRKFLRILTVGSAMVPLNSLLLRNSAFAQQEKLSEDDPLAKSLNYTHDATKATSSQREEDQFCYNCQLLQGDEGEWRPCLAFSNKLVNANGWCSAYVRKV
ncbi:MAG: high-potential iron-sulfur protein [Gammaproteobacteria bacterium]|nr:high-potential iron-sulfur protein [Gammaproteobacteria bacterium]